MQIFKLYETYLNNFFNNDDKDVFDSNIIFEDILKLDILNNLFEYIIKKFKENNTKQIVYLSGKAIKDLLPNIFKNKKYIKDNKNLIICKLSFTNFERAKRTLLIIDKNMTDDMIHRLFNNPPGTIGYFTYKFEFLKEKNAGLLVFNEDMPKQRLFEVFNHEFHHYYQWASGRSLSNIDKTSFNKISEEKIKSIQKVYNISNFYAFFNKFELTAYSNTIFQSIINLFKEFEIDFDKNDLYEFLKLILDCISKEKTNQEFEDYRNSIVDKLSNIQDNNDIYPILEFTENTSFAYLIISAYLKIGFNTIKNHLYSYAHNYCT